MKILPVIRQTWSHVKFIHVFLILVLLVGVYFSYQVFVEQPSEQRAQEEVDKILSQSSLSTCLDTAQASYRENWSNSCKAEYAACIDGGSSDDSCTENWNPDLANAWNCSLPTYTSNRWDAALQQDKENCYTEYPQD